MPEKMTPYTAYNTSLLARSRELRHNMTKQERHLWYDFLRAHPIKFYKQRSIDKFIVDFYCDAAKLAIELDGSQHYTDDGQEYDSARTAVLNGYGVEVLRFSNSDVDNSFNAVCQTIDQKVKELLFKALLG